MDTNGTEVEKKTYENSPLHINTPCNLQQWQPTRARDNETLALSHTSTRAHGHAHAHKYAHIRTTCGSLFACVDFFSRTERGFPRRVIAPVVSLRLILDRNTRLIETYLVDGSVCVYSARIDTGRLDVSKLLIKVLTGRTLCSIAESGVYWQLSTIGKRDLSHSSGPKILDGTCH